MQAVAAGAKGYLTFLARAVIFPLAWMWALALAKKHQDTDPKAVSKVVAGIVAGVVLAAGGFLMLAEFSADAHDNMYDLLNGRMSVATGASEYQDQVSQVGAKQAQIDILEAKIEEANAAGDEAGAAEFQAVLDEAVAERAIAQAKMARLQRNNDFYASLTPVILAKDDAQAKAMLDDFAASTTNDMYADDAIPAASAIKFTVGSMEYHTAKNFGDKDKAQDDMTTWMTWLFLPGLIGAFYAPLMWACGSIMKNAWEPSETVGYKPYPGGAMGWFLLLGGFGVPALFFSAWAFWDMDVRSVEGQISL